MSEYTEEYIKNKIEKSDIWVTRSITSLIENDKVQPVDKDLFSSLADYIERFDQISEKHILWVRKKLLLRYIKTIHEIANS